MQAEEKAAQRDSERSVYVLPLLFLLVALPYLSALHHEFAYDDHGQILENAYLANPMHVRELLTLQTLRDGAVINGRRPLVLLTYMLDRAVWGTHAFGFHLTNLLLHLVSVWLLFRLVLALSTRGQDGDRSQRLAFTAALVFGAHPVLTESVHLPSFRPDIMYTLFLLLHLHVGRSLADTYGGRWTVRIAAGVLTMLAAATSKETAVIAPVLLGAMWFLFPATRPERGSMALVLSLDLAVLAALSALCVGGAPIQAAAVSWNGLSLPYPANVWTAPWLWVRYLALLFWPHPLVVDRVVAAVETPQSVSFVVGMGVLATTLVMGAGLCRRRPWLSFSLLWMLMVFLPVSNLLPLINPLAERYMYGMAAGFGILIACLLHELPVRAYRVLLSLVVVVSLGLSSARLRHWKNDQTLWAQTLIDQPDSARAHVWVGLDLKQKGDKDAATAAFEAALEYNPQNAQAWVNLAIMHGQAGDLKSAEDLLREAIRRRPEVAAAYQNLGFDLELQGRDQEAFEVRRQALDIDPYHLPTRHAVTEGLIQRGRLTEALAMVEGTLEIDPGDETARRAQVHLRRIVP